MNTKNLILITFLILLPIIAQAQTAKLVHYSGTITDAEGNGFTGSLDLTFNLYRTPKATTPMWTETHKNVNVTDGRYDILLGGITPLKMSFYEYYLEVKTSTGNVSKERDVIVGSGYNYRMWFLFSAYTIIWAAIFLYLMSLARRQKRVIADMQNLSAAGTAE